MELLSLPADEDEEAVFVEHEPVPTTPIAFAMALSLHETSDAIAASSEPTIC
jgi:hypothetical protein